MTLTTIRSVIIKAKLARQTVTVQKDDGEKITGVVEDLTEWTVTLRLPNGIMYMPVIEIENVKTPTDT